MKPFIACLAIIASLSAVGFAAEQIPAANKTVLVNLMDSYKRAAIDQVNYAAFAVKADAEGYKKAAQLFRAAADSKKVQLVTLDKAIAGLGGKAAAKAGKATVKSTKENLAWALKEVTNEGTAVYPKYMQDALPSKIKSALGAFYRGAHVQANMMPLFQSAVINMDSWKVAAANGFYVCQVCGNVTADVNFEDCTVCGVPSSNCKQIM